MAIYVKDISLSGDKYLANVNSKRGPKGNQYPCIVCGRGCNSTAPHVRLHGGGALIVTEDEAKTLDVMSDMGLYPVGRDCLKQNPELVKYVLHQKRGP